MGQSSFDSRRRRRILADPFPAEWEEILWRNAWFYGRLDETGRRALEDRLRVFSAETDWEGCRGQEITDEVRVTIGAHAALLTLGFEDFLFEPVHSVLVYPDTFVVPAGPDEEDDRALIGEAHEDGKVIVSWADVLDGGRRRSDAVNVVFHELAHQLDRMSGEVDGTLPTASREESARWRRLIHEQYESLLDAEERGEHTLLGVCATEDEGEFFGVAVECFFQEPGDFRLEYPELHEALAGWFRQDPSRLEDPLEVEARGRPDDEGITPPASDAELALWDRRVREHPSWVEAWWGRFAARLSRDELHGALTDLDELEKLTPGDRHVALDRGHVWLLRGAGRAAIRCFDQVLAERPGDIQALYGRADAWYGLGKWGRALRDVRQVLEAEPDWPEALELLEQIEAQRGRRGS